MKKLLLLFLLTFLSSFAFAQLNVKVMNFAAYDIIYDSISNRIYATLPSVDGTIGNSIGIINPNTQALENTVFMGSEPSVLALSDDGKYIYAGFDGSSTVRRFIVSTQKADIQFPLGSDNFDGPFYAYDICVMPHHPNTIAVSRIVKGSTGFYGVAIYDSGVPRPITTVSTYPNYFSYVLGFDNDSTMFGFDNHSTAFSFNLLKVDSSGVQEVNHFGSVIAVGFNGFNTHRFIIHNNRVYFDYGEVVDVSNKKNPYVAGTFSGAYGPVAYDFKNNQVCYATFDNMGQNLRLLQYNPNTFLLENSMDITGVTGQIYKLITCGKGKYAILTYNGEIVLLTENTTGITYLRDPSSPISIFPNPAVNSFSIKNKGHKSLEKVTMFDMQGRVVLTKKITHDEKIDISNLENGIYLVKLTDQEHNEYLGKLLKR